MIYLVSLKAYTIAIIAPLNNAIKGRYSGQYNILAHNKIPLRAPAGQKTLKLLEANIDAISEDQIAVISHWIGVAPLAIAREMESGIVTIATTNPDFRFDFRFDTMSLKFQFIFYNTKKINKPLQ